MNDWNEVKSEIEPNVKTNTIHAHNYDITQQISANEIYFLCCMACARPYTHTRVHNKTDFSIYL